MAEPRTGRRRGRSRYRTGRGGPSGARIDRTAGGRWSRGRGHAPWAPMFRCQDIVELLADYLDGALGPAVAAAREAHLAGRWDCAAFVATYLSTVRAARTGHGGAERVPRALSR